MKAVPRAWIFQLFKRFKEIYGPMRYDEIDIELYAWEAALFGMTGEVIKKALLVLRNDTATLPSPDSFKQLCGEILQGKWADKFKSEALESKVDVKYSLGWREKLLAMDDFEAVRSLTPEQQYDRSRLLSQQFMNGSPVIKPDIDRKDWK